MRYHIWRFDITGGDPWHVLVVACTFRQAVSEVELTLGKHEVIDRTEKISGAHVLVGEDV